MAQPNRPLRVFLYHDGMNPHAVSALCLRLVGDGIDVALPEDGESVAPVARADTDVRQLRENMLRDAVWENDVMLVCVSKGSMQDRPLDDIKLVSSTAALKQQGMSSVIPVQFEECDVPDSLKRWQAMSLRGEDGYEKLMQALKLRAERLGIAFERRGNWQSPLHWEGEAGKDSQEEQAPSKGPSLTIGAAVLAVLLLLFWVFPGNFPLASKKAVPVEVMVENSTQIALEKALNRSQTQTALAQFVRLPITQTAAAIETQQHPPTPTLQFPTIIALPTEIMAPGNIKMVFVPGDNFLIGNQNESAGVHPGHVVYVEPFYIDKYEVTNVLYRLCVDVGECEPPKGADSKTRPIYYGNVEFNEYPVVNVDWYMAKQYCEWRGARLPTEAEWEKAARHTDGRTYPWGYEAPDCAFANYDGADAVCVGDTVAVGGYENGQSVYGAFNMSGNVSEWVNSLYLVYPYLSTDGREDAAMDGLRVVRGGSWRSPVEEITTYHRFGVDPSRDGVDTGFRCARDAGQ